MSNTGGYAVTRTHSGDRFYNPPAMRRHQQLLVQQQIQRQLQRTSQKENRRVVGSAEAETRTDSDKSALQRPSSVYSDSAASPPKNDELTNLDRLMESVTPFVPAQFLSEAQITGSRSCEADMQPFFSLEDLWESFNEWSAYGREVPLLLNGSDSVKQYYVPSLSGIQLYIDPNSLRKPSEDNDADSSKETNSVGKIVCEAERGAKGVVQTHDHHDLMYSNLQRLNSPTLRDKPPMNSSNDETEICKSMLIYEYLEQEQPHHRPPLYDKVSSLAFQFPEIRKYRSCDLLPTSWISVAWYPIYRIPVGQTLQNLDTSFLTFHYLSTHSRCKPQAKFHAVSGKKISGKDSSPKFSVPTFGLATYKLRGSILTPNGAYEWQQASPLMKAADDWLQNLQVNLPDFQFFASHSQQWR